MSSRHASDGGVEFRGPPGLPPGLHVPTIREDTGYLECTPSEEGAILLAEARP
jgi:hypothetical protein